MKTAKRTLAVLLACLMVFGSFGMVGSAKGNSSEEIDPVADGYGTVTYGLDIYKDGEKLSSGDTLEPGDIVEVQVAFGTDFYMGLVSTIIFYDSTYFQPYLDGGAYTQSPTNPFKGENGYSPFIKQITKGNPKTTASNGETDVTLFDMVTTVDNNGYAGLVNKASNDTVVKRNTPLAWRTQTINGQPAAAINNKCDIAPEYANYHFIQFQFASNNQNGHEGANIKVPYAPYFSFQMQVKDDADSNGEPVTAIFIPIDAARRATSESCNVLYATNTDGNNGQYTTKPAEGAILNGQGYKLAGADYDFTFGEGSSHTHTYGDPVWTWNDDYTEATATFYCTDPTCGVSQAISTTDIDSDVVDEASCGVDQTVKYLASVDFEGQSYSTETDPIAVPDTALEHSYGEPAWEWADDYSTATATFTCGNCGDEQVIDATIATETISELSCTTDSVVKYTATVEFNNDSYEDSTDEITLEAADGHTWSDDIEKIDEQYHGHKCTECGAVDEDTKVEHVYNIEGGIIRPATLTEPGLKLMECVCGAQKEVEFTLDHEHTYGEPVWSWNDDYTEATATFTCVDGDDTQTVTTTDIDCEELEEAECGKDKVVQYLASVEFGDETYETSSDPVSVPGTALEHAYGEPVWAWADDYSTATATFTCDNCGDEQVIDATIATETISELGCESDYIVKYVATAEFNNDSYEDSTDEITLDTATGHSYGEPTWEWADDYSSATATFTCDNCGDEQIVDADSIDMTVIQDITCVDDKIVTYTATINDFNGESYSDTTDEVVAEVASGEHAYGEPVWEWADDYSTATATFTCEACGDEQIVQATIATETISELSCTTDNIVKYVATAEFNNDSYEDSTDEITLDTATGHTWGDSEWVADAPATPDGISETHTRTCTACGETETENHTYELDPDKSTPATIDAGGLNVYVCSVCGAEYSEETAQLDHTHEYGEPTWYWADGYTSATATFTCGLCSDELVLTDDAPVMNTVQDADCTNDQVVTYTATVNLEGTDYSDTTDEITVPDTATGHNWGTEPTSVEWADDYSSVTATFTCGNCGETQTVTEAVDPDVDFNIVEEPGCGKDAVVEYTKTITLDDGTTFDVTSQPVTKEGSALSDHVYGEPAWEWADDYSEATAVFTCDSCGDEVRIVADIDTTVTELGCETDESVTYTAVVEFNGTEYTDDQAVVNTPATGHAYGEPEWVWADDYSSATATFTCDNCGDEVILDAEITPNTVSELTCTDDHVVTYTATVKFGEEEIEYSDTTDEVVVEEADGHVYGEPVWTWNDDYTEATATFTCENCGDVQTVTTTDIDCEVLEEPECEKDQVVQYLASVEFGDEIYETTSDPVTQEDTATGHSYGEPTWEWADDYSSATATFTCENCGHEEEVTDEQPVENEISALDCETDHVATFTATVVFGEEQVEYTDTTDEVTVEEATGHSYGEPTWEWADDYSSATATFTCDNCGHQEVLTDDEPVQNEISAQDCENDHVVTYTATVAFGEEQVEYTDTTDEITLEEATGHSYGDPTWEWADDYSSATATFTCDNCGHEEEVTDEQPVENEISALGCEADHVVTYTATVLFGEEQVEYTDTTDEITLEEATGHSYGDPAWEWADDYSSATATFTCDNCGHQEVLTDDEPIENEISAQDCENDHVVTYTATVTFGEGDDAQDYSDTTDEITLEEATGHSYGDPTWEWADDYSSATATFTCDNCGHEEEVTDEQPVENEISPLGCESDHVVTYTATVLFGEEQAEYTDTTDEITVQEATGHKYGDPIWTWADDHSSATATFICENCGDEVTLDATIDAKVTQELTCTDDELTVYTATVNFNDAPYTDSTDAIVTKEAQGHDWGEWADYDENDHIHYCQNEGCDAYETAAHEFSEWTVVTEPTATSEGEETRTCDICGRVESRPIEKLNSELLLYVNDSTEGANVVRVTVPYGRRGTTAFTLRASEEDVTYTMSAGGRKILSVDENGKVTYKRLCLFCRNAVITAETPDGRTATCEVTLKMKWWQIIIWLLLGSLWY